jgi:uncharacterized protein
MAIGLLTLTIILPECRSLKDKRSRVKPVLSRLHREFNVATAEVSQQDDWNRAGLAICTISQNSVICRNLLAQVTGFIEKQWPDLEIIQDKIEII